MKNLLTLSVLFSLMLGTAAIADDGYAYPEETQNSARQSYYSDRIDTNRNLWNQTIRSYEVNYNDSIRRFWDQYTDAYQRQKKIQH